MTPRLRFAAAAVLAAVLSSDQCLGQDAPGAKGPPAKEAAASRPAPKDGAEVLAGLRETLATPIWQCRSRWEGGIMGLGPGADTNVLLRHDPAGHVTGVRMTGNFMPRTPRFVAASADGEKLRAADLDEKVYEDTPWSMEALMMAPAVGPGGADVMVLQWVVPLEFWQPGDMAPGKDATAKLAGTATADGVLCDMVDVERALPSLPGEIPKGSKQVTRFVVGRDDHLPRRIIKKWPGGGMGSLNAAVTYVLTAWKLSPAIDEHTFEVDVTGLKEGKFKIPFVKDSSMGPPGGIPGRGSGPSIDLKTGDQPSDFALKDVSGKEYKLSASKGKPVLVHFCDIESSASDGLLTKMKAKHGDKLVILDLVVDHAGGGLDAVKKAKKPVAWPRLVGGEAVADAWGINLLTLAVVIGPDGKVAARIPTGFGGKNADAAFDAFVKKMGEYLKNPAKGW
jgi:hypothetical protein